MKRWLLRIALAMAFGWIMGNGTAMAQEATPRPSIVAVVPPPQACPVRPTAAYEGTPAVDTGRPLCDCANRGIAQTNDAIIAALNSKGCGCMGNHATHGCMSSYGQYIFFFGSCREWFGEACAPPPPTTSDRPFARILTLFGK